MTRLHLLVCVAATVLAAPALAQVDSGGASSPTPSAGAGGAAPIRPLTGAPSPATNATTGRDATTSVPDPATNPNSQVPPSAAGLPGGGGNVPLAPGSGAGEAVPVYGTNQSSVPSVAGSIDESAQRSQDTDCGGTGTRSASGTGTASASGTSRNCADATSSSSSSSSAARGGTANIMGGSQPIDVTTP